MRRAILPLASVTLLAASASAFAPGILFERGGQPGRVRGGRRRAAVRTTFHQQLLSTSINATPCFTRYERTKSSLLRLRSQQQQTESKEKEDADAAATITCWNPKLRQTMAAIAAAGALETAYLTAMELQGRVPICTAEGAASCTSVLTGPYAHLPGTEVPLAALGFLAYAGTLVLAVRPLLQSPPQVDDNNDDTNNRILLTALTTTMGVFSAGLMFLLFGVLHASCPYCVASAVCSTTLAALAWWGGALPRQDPRNSRQRGIQLSITGGVVSFLTALLLFVANDPAASSSVVAAGSNSGSTTSTTTLLARNSNNKDEKSLPPYAPPAITTDSSPTALALADDLQKLNAAFYGAFWCSHCYDQKQALGQQAMARIPYVECSKEGVDANTALCKDKKVPGYPTWEIAGQLYPGEQAIEELQEIVAAAAAAAASSKP